MATLHDLDTPAVVVDLPRAERNLARAQAYADAHGLPLRPHVKTHKIPAFARRQVELGAVGITCQKLGEAEVMADAGIEDIFLPYNILGRAKLDRLIALNRRVRFAVTADSTTAVEGYADAMRRAGGRLTVLIECDTGHGRCGVTTPEGVSDLARTIDRAAGLRFGGLMTYPAAGRVEATGAWLARAAAAVRGTGIEVLSVSSGGTPDLWRAHELRCVNEYRPGTYVYLDRFQVDKGVGAFDDCALTVLATVVSRPTEDRAVIDAGSKALSGDTLGLTGFGRVLEYPEAAVVSLSEEHGVLDLRGLDARPAIGERLRVLPNHACVVSNLVDAVTLADGERVLDRVPVAARGRIG